MFSALRYWILMLILKSFIISYGMNHTLEQFGQKNSASHRPLKCPHLARRVQSLDRLGPDLQWTAPVCLNSGLKGEEFFALMNES